MFSSKSSNIYELLMNSVNKVFPFHSDVVLNDSILPGMSVALKFSDLGAEIGKCNVAPKVEVSIMYTKILKNIFNALHAG